MSKPVLNLPENNIAEVTLIGTGGGYGESLVIHLGDQNWMIVDSCINPSNKQSLPLEYLININADLSQVKLIVCTHWHDDHILGLSQLFDKCPNAILSFASALDKTKFLELVTLDYEKLSKESSLSSTKEFHTCLNIAQAKKQRIKGASIDKLLLSINLDSSNKIEVFALSPSEYTLQEFNYEISTLITEYGQQNKKLVTQSPNSKSVVIYIKIGSHRILLGADLEISDNIEEGWINIIDNSEGLDRELKCTLFKIPHHGSENGYHLRIWDELLESNPTAKLTPWNKNKKLPNIEMLKKYSGHTNSLYMTTAHVRTKPKKRDKQIEKIIDDFKLKLSEVSFNEGIIRSRIDITKPSLVWETDLFKNSIKVNPLLGNPELNPAK